MRAVSACLLFAIAAAVVSAQTCTAPSSDPLNPSVATGCNLTTVCQTNLCACTGSNGTFPTCLATNSLSCSATQACYSTYFACLTAVSSARTSNNTACTTYATNLYMAQLAAAAATTFNTTALSASCGYDLCLLFNQTGNTASCGSSSVVSAVCTMSNLLPAATAYDIVATFTLNGGNWASIVNNATLKAQCIAGLATDIASLLGVPSNYIVILSISVGSLIVNWAVLQGSGKSPAQLQTTVTSASGGSISWLSSTKSLYTTSTGGTDFTGVTATIQQTAGPTTLPPGQTTPAPTPTKSSATSAAGVFAVAAVAAIAALLA